MGRKATIAAARPWWPLALGFLITGSLIVPFSIPTGTQTDLNFTVLFLAPLTALWLAKLWLSGGWRRLPTRAAPALLALVATAVVSFVVANQPWVFIAPTAPLRAQLGGLLVFVLSAAAFLMAAYEMRSLRWLQALTALFLALGWLYLVARIVPVLGGYVAPLFPLGMDGGLFWTWLVALSFSQALSNPRLTLPCRLGLVGITVAALYVGLVQQPGWLSGWLPALVTVVVILWLAAPRTALVVTVVGATVAAFNLPRIVGFVATAENLYGLATRIEAGHIVARIAQASPALGLGPANYYYSTPFFPLRGWYVHFSSHNTVMDLFAQTGLIGLGCFLWFVWEVGRLGWQLRRQLPAGFARAYVNSALGGLVGMLVAGMLADWVLPFVYNVTLNGLRASVIGWLFLGGLVAVQRLEGRPKRGQSPCPGQSRPGGLVQRGTVPFSARPLAPHHSSRGAVPAPSSSQSVTAQPPARELRRRLGWVIALALVLRLIVALALGDHATPVSGAADQYTYDALAQRVVEGHGFTFPTGWYPYTPPNEPTAHWSYAYTLYLVGVYAIAGHHPLVARLLQVLLSGIGCWLIYRIGLQLFGQTVGLAAALLTAVYAYFIFFNAALMTQTFYILALLAAMTLALDLPQQPTRHRWLLLGCALGLGTLLRQTLLLFVPIMMGWIVWASGPRLRWRDLLLSVAVIALLILPWTLYNYRTFGDFLLLNSNGGFFLYSSNHPNQGTHFDPNYAAPLPEGFEALAEPARDRALYREGLRFIVDEPGRFMRLTLSRVPHYFWILPSANSSVVSNLARLCSFTLYLPFMVYGLYLSRRRWRACLPLYLYTTFDTTLHLVSWAAPRYRLPSDALLMAFAGLAVVDLQASFMRRWPRRQTP